MRVTDVIGREVALFGIAASTIVAASGLYLKHMHYVEADIIRSPLDRILSLPSHEQKRLPYPPDMLPGARDVLSPCGSIRVYEWGPETGRKVLLIHGISTPAVALSSIAEELVRNGCRVMLFDLFGRGYSDTPDPRKYPQDMTLFTTQILLALTSSPVHWTGQEGFSLLGYSLGGGIAANFASYFPMVRSLILIAPGGLMRTSRIHWTSKLIYDGFLPERLVSWLVWRRLGGHNKSEDKHSQIMATDMVDEEAAPHPALSRDSPAPLSPRRPSVSVSDVVTWQLHNHVGFLPAFVSSIQHAPISNQHEHWRRIRSRLEKQRKTQASADDIDEQSLREGKVLIVLGKEDDVVLASEVAEDARAVLSEKFVVIKQLDGGHDLPVVAWAAVTQTILDFWIVPCRKDEN